LCPCDLHTGCECTERPLAGITRLDATELAGHNERPSNQIRQVELQACRQLRSNRRAEKLPGRPKRDHQPGRITAGNRRPHCASARTSLPIMDVRWPERRGHQNGPGASSPISVPNPTSQAGRLCPLSACPLALRMSPLASMKTDLRDSVKYVSQKHFPSTRHYPAPSFLCSPFYCDRDRRTDQAFSRDPALGLRPPGPSKVCPP
jgi:hypothetical protein